jgi:hypothetical protein
LSAVEEVINVIPFGKNVFGPEPLFGSKGQNESGQTYQDTVYPNFFVVWNKQRSHGAKENDGDASYQRYSPVVGTSRSKAFTREHSVHQFSSVFIPFLCNANSKHDDARFDD